MKNKLAKIIAKYSKQYDSVELDQLNNFLAKFQKEVLKALGKKYEELSFGAQSVLGNSWILIDTLKYKSIPEKWIEAVSRG